MHEEIQGANKRIEFLKFQIDDIEKNELKPGEDVALYESYNTLTNSEKIKTTLENAYDKLNGSNYGGKSIYDDLNNIVEVLREFSERKIRVTGHTDSTGPEDYNLSLSLRRARRTVMELKTRNPDLSGRITYIGLGESKPVASNETEEGRRKNRRVEIIILKP